LTSSQFNEGTVSIPDGWDGHTAFENLDPFDYAQDRLFLYQEKRKCIMV